ncbi:MAG: response regulator [Bacteroidetes bacterium]|nr:response regulator [Bacteroidota bacterium]
MENNNQKNPPIIMLIDDTPEDLYINHRVLKKHAVYKEVIQFSMATDAILHLQNEELEHSAIPDIIFLDIHMPLMNGFEFLDAFDALPAPVKHKCKIFILSSSFDQDDIERSKNNPYVKQFFEKPLTKEVLEKVLI